jgi:hypothetical protein
MRRRSARGGWDVPCPVRHNHPRGDLRWSGRLFFSADGTHLRYWCGKGCKWADACSALGIDKRLWLRPDRRRGSMNAGATGAHVLPREVCAYSYTDHAGVVVYEKVRTEPKGFYHRRRGPGGKGYCYSLAAGWYAWNKNRWQMVKEAKDKSAPPGGDVHFMEECRKVPFQWLDLRKRPNHPVCVVEGEKAASLLSQIGYTAICSPDGAGKWPLSFGGYLSGRDVVVFPDNDEVGVLHASQVVGSAVVYEAKSFRVIRSGQHGYALPRRWGRVRLARIHLLLRRATEKAGGPIPSP